jgi:hypothetical protein
LCERSKDNAKLLKDLPYHADYMAQLRDFLEFEGVPG